MLPSSDVMGSLCFGFKIFIRVSLLQFVGFVKYSPIILLLLFFFFPLVFLASYGPTTSVAPTTKRPSISPSYSLLILHFLLLMTIRLCQSLSIRRCLNRLLGIFMFGYQPFGYLPLSSNKFDLLTLHK